MARSTIRLVGRASNRRRGVVLKRWLSRAAIGAVLAGAISTGLTSAAFASVTLPGAALPPTSVVTLDVRASRNSLSTAPGAPKANQPIPKYRWLLNLDNTGSPYAANSKLYCHPSSNIAQGATPPAGGTLGVTYVVTAQGYPQGCEWPSVRYALASPAVSEGTNVDWNTTTPLPVGGTFGVDTGLANNCPTIAEPVKACRYLLTVMADGYQIGGVHFAVPSSAGTIAVYLNPYPIPLGTIRLKAFDDSSPTDGTYDEATEKGLAGFHGILNDVDGIIQADYFGNPLCTEYLTYQNQHPSAPGYTTNAALVGKIVLNRDGRPTPLPAHDPAPPDPVTGYFNPTVPGDCLSDSNGDIVIPNMPPNHYSANVTPPIGSATNWVQTTTLEGNHDFDVWVMPDQTGLDTELVVGGEPVPFVQFGFAHEKSQPSAWSCNGTPGQTPGCGRITGQLYQANTYVPGYGALPGVGGANGTSGVKLQNPIDRGWVALNSLNASTGDFDTMVATVPTQDPTRVGLQYPDCPQAPTQANPTTAGWGCFEFSNVPDGEYMLTIWDQPQDTALDAFNATISHGQIVQMGALPLLGWFSHIYGRVCVDSNANGRCDPGEKGIFHQVVQNLNRTNNSMVGGINTSNTDNNGYYDFKEAYPLGLMAINQFFFTRFKTTGITWQSCNDPQEHTVIAPMVDVSYLPIIGQCGRLDWAVVPYSPSANGDNGGIVATQRDDYTRQKYNSRQAQTNDYQTGIPGFTFEQYTPIKGIGPGGSDLLSGYALDITGAFCTVEGTPIGTTDNPQHPNCGSFSNPALAYISENNAAPAQCFPQDAQGNPIGYVPGNVNSYDFMVSGGACIESTASGTQFGLGTDNAGAPLNHPVQTVDGNYTLGNIPGLVPAQQLGDVLVKNIAPVDTVLPPVNGVARSLFTFTKEEDVNFFSGAQYVPQGSDTSGVRWPPVPGPANQMPNDLSKPDGGYDENPYTYTPGPDALCAGVVRVVHVTDPVLLANGGSPFEGTVRHLCDTKLLNVQAGQSIAPDFHVHTVVDIPLPAHFWGYIVDDISVETNRQSLNLGEVHGIPNAPVGVYDWTGRRVYSVNSDYNGVWELLMPSSDIFNCLTPSQVCPNVYRFVGNDPGQPAHPNLNYNPNYRTISANFEAWPNMLVPADTAPWRIATGLEGPVAQFSSTSPCGIKAAEPELFAVGPDPFVRAPSATLTIQGVNFGPTQNGGAVNYTPDSGGPPVNLAVTRWDDQNIAVTVGRNHMPTGSGTISVTNGSGLTTANGIAFHVIGGAYNPHVITVGLGKMIDPFQLNSAGQLVHPFAIQDALDRAATGWRQYWTNHSHNPNDPNNQWLVAVYPKWDPTGANNTAFVPLGTYFENVIVHSPLELQGVGPGGVYADGTVVQGSLIDGRFWSQITPGQFDQPGAPGTEGPPEQLLPTPSEPNVLHWVNLLAAIQATGTGFTAGGAVPYSGGQDPGEGAVVTVLGTTGTYPTNNRTGIDGFTISGGDLSDFPGNLNEVSGSRTGPFPEGGNTDESAGALSVQGGAVFVNGGTDQYRVTDNLVKQNSGAYGAVRFGTEFQVDPGLAGGLSHNHNAMVSHNVFVANGGTNLAGAIGIFDDTNGYSIDHNTFCMNLSAEYGGAISHFGYSPNGKISYNRIFLNTAYDEGGAITIASEPAFSVVSATAVPDPKGFTNGTGAVSVDHNYIGDNLAQDDGGAMRVMGTAGTKGLSPISITNNVITNNVSAHEGGAISMADAPVVDIVNNTIAHNVTTATATTSDGNPAPAGIAVDINSAGLNALLATQYAGQVPSWMQLSTWPRFSNARIENDILWYNRAGSWAGAAGVAGIGMPGDTTALNFWDVGSSDAAVLLTVRSSVIGSSPTASNQQYLDGGGNVIGAPPTNGLCSNVVTDPNSCAAPAYNLPNLVNPYATILSIVQQRTYFRFRPAAIISVDLPANLFDISSYRIGGSSPAQNLGFNPVGVSVVPHTDIEDRPRPHAPAPVDAGAYQLTPAFTGARPSRV
jgi:hypothetical protein